MENKDQKTNSSPKFPKRLTKIFCEISMPKDPPERSYVSIIHHVILIPNEKSQLYQK